MVKELSPAGTYRYTVQQNESATFFSRLNNIFRECVIKLDYAQNIVVVKTMPGLASAACSACLLYTSPSPRDVEESRMPSSA